MHGTTSWARGVGWLVLFIFGCGTGKAISDSDAGQDSTDTVRDIGAGVDGSRPDIVRPTTLDWGTVDIRFAATQPNPTGMTVKVVDEGTPSTLDTTLQFPPTTVQVITDGAAIVARHECENPSLFQIEMSSCANDTLSTRTSTTGCLAVVFDEKGGVAGNFIHPTGARCDIKSGEASFQMPSGWDEPPIAADAGPPPPDVAVGTFVLACLGVDGTHLRLEGDFALPVWNTILLCSP